MNKKYSFKSIPNEDLILNLDVSQLREQLLKGTFTSTDLVHVFGKRCFTIGREFCLSAEENFEEALVEAERKDKEREEAI